MQAIVETLFDTVYLFSVIFMSYSIIYGVSVIRLKAIKPLSCGIKNCSVYDASECLAQCRSSAFLGNLPKYSVCTDGINYHCFIL